MTKDKDLKRVVRSRMQKTGESYTAARTQVIRKKQSSDAVPTRDLPAMAGMSDDAVRAKTGRSWAEWVTVLDAGDAAAKPHREIAAHLHDAHGLSAWWAQTVTVGYERIRGFRKIGQRREGSYEANKTKTYPVSVEKLYRAFSVARTRRRWLTGLAFAVRTTRPGKSIRIACGDGTSIDVYFYAKGDGKSSVNIQHRKLPTKADAERRKEFWTERLAALGEVLR